MAAGIRDHRRETLAERIDDLLPQTQCGQCNHPGCRPYAEAIAEGRDEINHCPPGGRRTIEALARLLDRDPRPLDPANGVEKTQPTVVWIDEAQCIGCALCLKACPVDAIVGAPKRMHTVITAECTGCDLCIAPCPVDCIHVRVLDQPMQDEAEARRLAHHARQRYRHRQRRLERLARERELRRREKRAASRDQGERQPTATEQRKAVIQAAIARVREKRRHRRDHEQDDRG